MQIDAIGKVNKDNYKLFRDGSLSGYEIYLASEDDFVFLPEMLKALNIVSAHQPGRGFNLCQEGEIGCWSFQTMEKMLAVLKSCGYKGIIVIHGNNFDESSQNRDECMKLLAGRLDKLNKISGKIRISLETDVLFFNLIGAKRALLALPENFKLLASFMKSPLLMTLDFEHIWITSFFAGFIKELPEFYKEFDLMGDSEKELVKKSWLSYTKEKLNEADRIVGESLKRYSETKIPIINFHINGTNPEKYWFDEKTFLPLEGEHLCLGEPDDKLDYGLIGEYLPRLTQEDSANLVMEIWPRGASDCEYFEKSLESAGYLEKKLCQA